jgi:hypothetical protein
VSSFPKRRHLEKGVRGPWEAGNQGARYEEAGFVGGGHAAKRPGQKAPTFGHVKSVYGLAMQQRKHHRLRFNHPGVWFVEGRGKPYFPATWEGWIIFLGLLLGPFIAAALSLGG